MATAPNMQYPATIERNGETYAFRSTWKNMTGEQLVVFRCVSEPSRNYILVDVNDELVEFNACGRVTTAFENGEIKKGA